MTNAKIKVLYAASEAAPFITTGGLGEVAGSLPRALKSKYGHDIDIRIILPLHHKIPEHMRNNLKLVTSTMVPLSWRRQYCGILSTVVDNVTYYFIDNEYYFKRNECYGHFDDGERFAFFCKAVLFTLPLIDFIPDIIHANDWQTALIPVYLSTKYGGYSPYSNIRTVMTIHNIEYQGVYDLKIAEDVFDLYDKEKGIVEYNGAINLMKGALETANVISTVSPSYAEEIFDDTNAHGLAPLIRKNSRKVIGIMNGIDTASYNPSTDAALFKNFDSASIEDKYENKTSLQRMMGLPCNPDVPVIAMTSRLVKHKGLNLVMDGIDEILRERVQFMLLGKGDRVYELFFKSLQERYHDKVSVRIDHNNDLSRKIYAGADMFIMPSISEPCGIAQMISSRYGTVPIVRETGGLKDSIKDCGLGEGNGFTFYEATSDALIRCVKRALGLYYDKLNWQNLIKCIMDKDFSWEHSGTEYMKMYRGLKE